MRMFRWDVASGGSSILMALLTVRHLTVYRYSEPVELGEHRMMFRPRESHDLRLVNTQLDHYALLRPVFAGCTTCSITPWRSRPSTAKLLNCGSTAAVTLEHFEIPLPDYPLEEYARAYPFRYADDELPDLAQGLRCHYPSHDG